MPSSPSTIYDCERGLERKRGEEERDPSPPPLPPRRKKEEEGDYSWRSPPGGGSVISEEEPSSRLPQRDSVAPLLPSTTTALMMKFRRNKKPRNQLEAANMYSPPETPPQLRLGPRTKGGGGPPPAIPPPLRPPTAINRVAPIAKGPHPVPLPRVGRRPGPPLPPPPQPQHLPREVPAAASPLKAPREYVEFIPPSVASSSLVTFCGRVLLLHPRSRPFMPRKDAFLRLRGDVITLHRDEDTSELVATPLSLSAVRLVKADGPRFKIYYGSAESSSSSEQVLRLQLEETLAPAFAFLLEESWERQQALGEGSSSSNGAPSTPPNRPSRRGEENKDCNGSASSCPQGGCSVTATGAAWKTLGRGWIREAPEEDWREAALTLTDDSIIMRMMSGGGRKSREAGEGGPRRVLDVRCILSYSPVFGSSEWCNRVGRRKSKGEEKTGDNYAIRVTIDGGETLTLDSGHGKCLSAVLALISSSIASPQTAIATCRLSPRGIPLSIERAIGFLEAEGRLSTHGMYRISAKSHAKEKLLEEMINSPATVLLSSDCLHRNRSALHGTSTITGGKKDPKANGHVVNGCLPTGSGEKEEEGGEEEEEEVGSPHGCKDEVFTVCDALRAFLRSMEIPLVPDVLHVPLFDAISEPSSSRCQKVSSVLRSRHFPQVHRATLVALVAHLRKVAALQEQNGMTADNLARVFAPAFFSGRTSAEFLGEIGSRVTAVHYLIEHYNELRM